MTSPIEIFSILSDLTRLRIMMLIQWEDEVCVCEMTHALEESQPKISRHLAVMRDAGIVKSRREGTWIHYRVEPDLPAWVTGLLSTTHQQLNELSPFVADLKKLHEMKDRPERACG